MKDERKTEIRVGITVVLGLIILLWILGWAKNFTLSSTDIDIIIKFKNVAGLEIGDNATVNGVRKGFVKNMRIEGDDVLVTISIDGDTDLRDDARFTLNMLDLMGGKRVEIYPGLSEKKLDPNKIYTGNFLSDIPSVMAVFGSVEEDLIAMLKDIRITLSSINKYLTDEKMESDVKTSLYNLSEISRKLNLLIDENREDIRTLTQSTAELTTGAINFLDSNKVLISESIQKLSDVLKQTDELLTKINKVADETLQQENNLGKLLYDENMMNEIRSSIEQLNNLTTILVEQLQGKGINVDANIF